MIDAVARRASAWHRFWALPGADRRLVLRLFLLLPAVAAGIRILGVRRLCSFLSGRLSAPSPGAGPDVARARELGRLVGAVAGRIPGRPACLTCSITLWYLLQRRGLPAEVRLGVRTAEGPFQAHAWVECGGEVLNDEQDVGKLFAVFEKLNLDSSGE